MIVFSYTKQGQSTCVVICGTKQRGCRSNQCLSRPVLMKMWSKM